MPNVNDLKSSKFLTKNDVEPPVLATIRGYEEMNVAMESQAPEQKWVLHFKELDKPLVLNMTNGQLIAAITGSENFDNWIGRQVVLYNDKNVSFGGKITGGIRIRGAKSQNPSNTIAAEFEQDYQLDKQEQPSETLPSGKPKPTLVQINGMSVIKNALLGKAVSDAVLREKRELTVPERDALSDLVYKTLGGWPNNAMDVDTCVTAIQPSHFLWAAPDLPLTTNSAEKKRKCSRCGNEFTTYEVQGLTKCPKCHGEFES